MKMSARCVALLRQDMALLYVFDCIKEGLVSTADHLASCI
jgi:hypothetical protein